MAAIEDRRNDTDDRSDDQPNKADNDVKIVSELFSKFKLNPFAKEFVPGSRSSKKLSADAPLFEAKLNKSQNYLGNAGFVKGFGDVSIGFAADQQPHVSKKNGYNHGRRRYNDRVLKAQKDECIRRTVYVSDIDPQVTEETLTDVFKTCGAVADCRVCGDPNSVLRFAFIEFTDEDGANKALGLKGTMLGSYPVKVLPSKTAILPVNPTLLPQSPEEREQCSRTIYCTNIDRMVTQSEMKEFFESYCGTVNRIRLLGDNVHSTRIAFVEFDQEYSATLALNCSGKFLGSLPIRVSPSKTPVRSCSSRASPQ